MTTVTVRLTIGLAVFSLLVPAFGQSASSCQIPDAIPAPQLRDAEDANPNVATDFYSLVLSWSPQHCEDKASTTAGKSKHAFQCELNNFEFVVHGLWPQSDLGKGKQGQPRHCKVPASPLPASLIRQHICTVPGAYLMQNEWQAHGTCAWDTPEAYFERIETEFARFARPSYRNFVDVDGRTTSGAIKQAFADANVGKLRSDQVSVFVGKKNRLTEIWICLDKSFNPQTCPSAGTPDAQRLNVEPPRVLGSDGVELVRLQSRVAAPAQRLLARRPLAEPIASFDVECPTPQRKFSGYAAAVKRSFWTRLYAGGGSTVYCKAPFVGQKTVGGLNLNIEHVVPQSKLSSGAAKSDLHNLWPSIVDVNSARGNYVFVDQIPGESWSFAFRPERELASCDFEVESVREANGVKVTVVEPAEHARGALARAGLHMALAYPSAKVSQRELALFVDWHKQHPVSSEERRRNDAIDAIQSTRNPFVDSPDSVDTLLAACSKR